MKGIIWAGGSGSCLYPMTKTISKQLLPVYDKPMIYYLLSTAMLFVISEILIISTPRSLPIIRNLLGDGEHLGLSLEYIVHEKTNGIAQAFVLGQDFIKKKSSCEEQDGCLIIGDN